LKPIRHFLSHQHLDRPQLALLEADMRRRGLLSWRDRKDQHFGAPTDPAVEEAIRKDTDGFVLYGSVNVLKSWYVWNREWPPAYLRHQAEHDAGHPLPYPLTPIFVGIEPEDLKQAAIDQGAVIPNPFNGERLLEGDWPSRRGVTRGLLRVALARRCATSTGPLRLHVTTFGFTDDHEGDLVVDWTDDFAGRAVPWSHLIAGRDDLKQELARTSRALEVTVQARLESAFVFGHAFPRASRISIAAGPGHWQVGRDGDQTLVACRTEPRSGDDRVAAVLVSFARQVDVAAERAIARLPADLFQVVRIGFADDVSEVNAAVAAAASHAFGRALRELSDRGVNDVHLFMAVPAELALLMGSAINAGPAVTLYHRANGEYAPSLTLR
jgi:hypothetical protein